MGLFDIFKKKKEEPVQNSLNSVFTLRFAVPYFSVFDKTNPKLRSYPVKVACGGSVQYRIADPNLCFDNIPLGQMAPAQLEEHVRDALISSIKHLINTIDYLPLLQFENELANINDTAKRMLIPQFAKEYGINLRLLTLTRISYDEDDPNYKRLIAQSAAISDKLGEHELENLELNHEDEKQQRNHRRRVKQINDEEEVIERETKLKMRRQAVDHEMQQIETRHSLSLEQQRLELEHKRKELDEDIHARRMETESKAERMHNKAKAEKLGMDIFDEDVSGIDDSFDI